MQTVNWAKLVQQNRAKAMGVPWSDEEMKLIGEGADPDALRAGVISKGESETDLKGDHLSTAQQKNVKLEKMKRDELIELARSLEIQFVEEDVTKQDLILEIRRKQDMSSESENISEEDDGSEE